MARGFSQLHADAHLRGDALQDAAFLLVHTLGISRAALIADHDRVLTQEQQSVYEAAIARRLTHEPIQYITGEREFYGLPLRVNSAVLIPRNSTEHVVESVLEEMKDRAGEPLQIVDVGTGSGAIAIALAFHLPQAQVVALDVSPAALEVAAANAKLNGLADRVQTMESDLLAAVLTEAQDAGRFDAVVSNPPYISSGDKDSLHPQVRNFEPEVSLYGGPAGMDLYRRLIPQAWTALKPGGLLALEVGRGQQEQIEALLREWTHVRFVDDLLGIPRVALARRP